MAKTNESPMPIKAEIQDLIYIIRGQQVMIDKDLATLYGVETKVLNQAVKRNIKRFPDDFMFQLTQEEFLRSQFVTSNDKGRGGTRYAPYVFTENGVAMLSGILRSETAVEVNIQIMRAFTKMRHFLSNNASIFHRLETMEYHQLDMQHHQQTTDKRLDEVFRRLDEGSCKPQQGVFYDGQVYDAYTFVADLVKSSLPPLPRPLSLHRRGCLSRWCIHQGFGQEVVWILQDGAAFFRRIGGENQPRMKAKNHIFSSKRKEIFRFSLACFVLSHYL